MTLYLLPPLSLLAFLLLHYVVTPRVIKSGGGGRFVALVGKPGLLAILKYAYTFFFIATLTYTLLALVALFAGLSGATSAAGFESAIRRIQSYRGGLAVFKSFWTVTLFAFLFVAVTLILYRRLRRSISAEVEEEKERLAREQGGGAWESLEPTAEMNEVAKKIFAAQVLFDRLDPPVARQSQEVLAARGELREKIRELRAEWHELDLERRAYRNVEARRGRAGSGAQRESGARTFFGSKGFLETLQRTSRAVGHVTLVLLFLSLVGVSAPLVDGALARRVVRLSDLQVKASQQEARESFARLLAEEEDGGQTEVTEEDEKALRDLSRHFERAFTSSPVWHPFYVYGGDAARIRRDLVRDKIIIIRRQKPPDGPSGPDSPKDGPGGPGPRRGPDRDPRRPTPPGEPPAGPDAPFSSDDIRARLGSDEWPRTGIGERFSADVRRGIIGKAKKFWGRIKGSLSAYAGKFGEPFEPLEFVKWAVGEAVGATVDSVWHHMPDMGEVKEPLKGTIKAGLKDSAKKLYESHSGGEDLKEVAQRVYDLSFEQFMTDLRGGMPLDEALGRVEAGVPGRPAASIDEVMKLRVVSEELLSSEVFENLEQSLKDNPPTVPEPARDVAEARAAAEKLKGSLNDEGRTSLRGEEFSMLYAKTDTYENHYPGRSGALEETPREEVRAKMKRPTDPQVSAELYAQSRDFAKLELSTDVGGVLIGREPDRADDGVDFRDLSWAVSGDEVTLRLKRADGGEVELGPFRRELVNNALVYVADGRKVVITIQTSFSDDRKVWRRRVLLHPALVDTALGGDIIEFDELVFKLTDKDPRRAAAEQAVDSQRLLYTLAWLNRRLMLNQLLMEQETDDSGLAYRAGRARLDAERIERMLDSPKGAAAIRLGLSDARKTLASETSLPTKYPAHFDRQLTQMAVECGAWGGGSTQDFQTCVQGKVRTHARNGLSEEVVGKWLAEPETGSGRSIAEERPYSVDSGLSFLSPGDAAQPASQLWPFEFRYEIAFPALTGERPASFWPWQDPDAYRAPWEYLELRPLIAEKVSQGVRGDAATRELFGRVRDFAVLQRLFRVSLDGRLGAQFPIEKLAGLTRATQGGRGKETPRWQVKPLPED